MNNFQKKQNYGIQYTVKPTFICNLILQLTSETGVWQLNFATEPISVIELDNWFMAIKISNKEVLIVSVLVKFSCTQISLFTVKRTYQIGDCYCRYCMPLI